MKKIGVWLFIAALAVAGCASQDSTGKRGLAVEALPETGADIEVFPRLGHSKLINSVVYSPDGRYIVSASTDQTVKIWEAETGRELRTLAGHFFTVSSAVYSPDGGRIASGADEIKIWDAKTGRELINIENDTRTLAFSPDGERIASNSYSTVKIWDAANGRLIHTLDFPISVVYGVIYSPDGKYIAAGGYNGEDKNNEHGEIRIWEAGSGKVLWQQRHGYAVHSVAFSPDNGQLISGSVDERVGFRESKTAEGSLKIWSIETGAELSTIPMGGDSIYAAAYSPDSRYIMGAGIRKITIWDAKTHAVVKSVNNRTGYVAAYASFDSSGKKLIASSENQTIKAWDTDTWQAIQGYSGQTDILVNAAYHPDNRMVATEHGNAIRQLVRVWDLKDGKEAYRVTGNKMLFSSDGKYLVVCDGYNIKILDAQTGNQLRSINTGHISSKLLFSKDSRHLLVSEYGQKLSNIKIWDLESGKGIFSIPEIPVSLILNNLEYYPDNKRIIYATEASLNIVDTTNGEKVVSVPFVSNLVSGLKLSHDGNYIFIRVSNELKIFNVQTGRELYTIPRSSVYGDYAALFSSDNKTMVTFGMPQSIITVRNITDGKELYRLKANEAITSIVYSPDGKYIIAGTRQGIDVWDASKGQKIHTIGGFSGGVTSIAPSHDSKTFAAALEDGTTRIFQIETGRELVRFIGFSGADNQIASATRGLTVETKNAAASADREWLAMTPEGYYQASPQGDRYINVRVGNTVTGIDAYRSVLYNPDVVQARLAGKPDPASKGAVTIQQAASFLPPTVTIRSPESNTATGSSTTTLSVAITDQNQPIQNIKIMVNGRILGREELSAVKGTGLQPQKASYTVTGNQKTVDFQLPLSLDPGPNRIEVVAFNGFSESRRYADLTWNAPAGQRPALPNLWILAVGVNSYADSSIRNLNYCVADAKSVVDSLKAQEGKRYGKVNSLLIADGEGLSPTAANIRQNLGFLEGAGPRDVALLFLAGHGVSGSAGAFFFLPADTRLNADGTVNPATAVTGAELFAALDAPGNRLVFIDACQSGGVDNDRLVRYLMDTNAFVFASSRGNELSQERPEFGHGVFTYSILNAIKGATAARAEGNVSVLSLSGFVSTDVPRITDDRQHPSAYSLGFYDFPLAAAP